VDWNDVGIAGAVAVGLFFFKGTYLRVPLHRFFCGHYVILNARFVSLGPHGLHEIERGRAAASSKTEMAIWGRLSGTSCSFCVQFGAAALWSYAKWQSANRKNTRKR